MIRWEIMLNPQAYAEAIASHPPLAAAILLLLTPALLLGVLTVCGEDLLIYRRFDRGRQWRLPFWSRVFAVAFLILIAWIVLTFLTLMIERWFGHTLPFEALFCLLAVAAIPQFGSWLTYAFRDISRPVLYVWRAFTAVLLLSTTARICLTLGAADHLLWWQSFLTVTPCLAALWGSSLSGVLQKPNVLRAARFWRRAAGTRVAVFYPPGNVEVPFEEIAREADILVVKIERLLDVKPLPFRIPIFLAH